MSKEPVTSNPRVNEEIYDPSPVASGGDSNCVHLFFVEPVYESKFGICFQCSLCQGEWYYYVWDDDENLIDEA